MAETGNLPTRPYDSTTRTAAAEAKRTKAILAAAEYLRQEPPGPSPYVAHGGRYPDVRRGDSLTHVPVRTETSGEQTAMLGCEISPGARHSPQRLGKA